MRIIESLNMGLAKVVAQSQSIFYNDEIKSGVEASLDKIVADTGEYTPSSIVQAVKSDGYIIIPAVFSGNILYEMRKEFDSIIASEKEFDSVDHHDGATCVRMRPFFRMKYLCAYPALFSFYNAKTLREITKLFYSGNEKGYQHVSEVFVHETPETREPLSGKLHWDRLQTLKYWVYLEDLVDAAGPMQIEPGSINRNQDTRATLLKEKNILVGGRDNVVDLPDRELVSLSSCAGSILIHDTDASHGASIVHPGHIRRIVRGHCRAII